MMPIPKWVYLDAGGEGRVLSGEELGPGHMDRAHRYGDGLFETMLWQKGRAGRLEPHYQRFFAGMKVLGLKEPRPGWRKAIRKAVADLCADSGARYARVRMQAWRAGGGHFRPEHDQAACMVEIYPLPSHPWGKPSATGLRVGIFHDVPLVQSTLSSVKSASALPYVMAARHASIQGWDDALLRSVDGGLAEASSSNLFVLRGATLFTPPLESGCLPGTLRARVMASAGHLGLELRQQRLDLSALADADEIFLTNAIAGIRPVRQVQGLKTGRLGHSASAAFHHHLQ